MSSASTTVQPPTLWVQAHKFIGWLKIVLYFTAGMFLLLLALEINHVYRVAADVHPWVGIGWLMAVGICLTLIAIPGWRYMRTPLVVKPPPIPPADELNAGHLRAELRYLDRYLRHLSTNQFYEGKPADVAAVRGQVADLLVKVGSASAGQTRELDKEISQFVEAKVSPLLDSLDAQADRMIYQESLGVGLATAASPNGTLDAFVMLWRSVNLVSKLACLYYGRPGPWGTLAICRDVSVATALAGYLQNLTDSLGGLLAKTLGGVTGVVAGPAIDGVTNGLVLIRIGYLAKNRCRSFRQWDTQTQRSAVLASLAATQKVAVGLTTEILRQVGGGIVSVAGVAGRGIASIAGATVESVGAAAQSAAETAENVGSAAQSAARSAADGVSAFVNKAVQWGQGVTAGQKTENDDG